MDTSLLGKINLRASSFAIIILVCATIGIWSRVSVAEEAKSDKPLDSQSIALPQDGYIGKLLDTFSGTSHDASPSGFSKLVANLPTILPDLLGSLVNVSAAKTWGSASGILAGMLFLMGAALFLEKRFTLWMSRKYFHTAVSPEQDLHSMGAIDKLSKALVHTIPLLLGIGFFLLFVAVAYALLFRGAAPGASIVFVSLLLCILGYKVSGVFAELLFSLDVSSCRLLPLSDATAGILRHLCVLIFPYIISVLALAAAFSRLGALATNVVAFRVIAATILLFIVAFMAIGRRKHVAEWLLEPTIENPGPPSEGRKNLAQIWHVLFVLYVLILWILTVNATAEPSGTGQKLAFFASFFLLPVWFVLDWLLVLIVRYVMSVLKIYNYGKGDQVTVNDTDHQRQEQGRATTRKSLFGARMVLVAVLFIWLAHLWGYSLPFVSVLSKAVFDSILIIALALTVWKFISNWIEAKIAEESPGGETDDDQADEFGSAVAKTRAYTFLPILKSFLGVTFGVLVVLTVLSSLGVNIGPLLAGAGVVGLAVGFGAQKLVSDILSGFFYLFDDAFRIGEYLQAGSVMGTVEKISLRNVMLRHHRGMLQIIPHSELGTITNYMRGGIIEKFNLDFPYDANVDKIRKVIKKVGAEMLVDPEFAADFMQPIKSQGIREITNSVMSIRVKFKAKPGRHFVIRREAFKRITEALNAQGIHYAHRKVIVDMSSVEQTNKAPALAAGAAMQQIIMEEEALAKQQQEQQKKKG